MHQRRVCERELTVAVLRVDSEVSICVYLAPELIGGCHPAIGDLLCCKGLLQAAPRNVEQGESWQDSPEIALLLHKRELKSLAAGIYARLAGTSRKNAAVAAAFVQAGWKFQGCNGNTLFFSNQLGEQVQLSTSTSPEASDCTHRCIVSFCEDVRQARLQLTPPVPGIPETTDLPR